jgi:hypothetical protein
LHIRTSVKYLSDKVVLHNFIGYQPAIPKVHYSERLLPTVALGFRQFGLGIANVGIVDLRNSGPNPSIVQAMLFLFRRCEMSSSNVTMKKAAVTSTTWSLINRQRAVLVCNTDDHRRSIL